MRIQIITVYALFLAIIFTNCQSSKEDESYDLVLQNGKIWTGNVSQPWVVWIAIKGNKIGAVGTEDEEAPFATDIIDLKGKLTVPGFNDSHVHFASAGQLLLGINLLDVNEDHLFVERIKETTHRLPKGSWITRGDWRRGYSFRA